MDRRTLGIGMVALLLAACGGGGGGSDNDACTSGSLIFSTTWTVTGGTWSPPLAGNQIVGRVGVPLTARPVHTGLPAGCVGRGVYAPGTAAPNLVPGLTIDPATGEISGTPTVAGGTPSTAGFGQTGAVQVTFPGFNPVAILGTFRIEP